MKYTFFFWLTLLTIILLSSCAPQRFNVSKDKRQELSRKLGFTVSRKDNIPLMNEICKWLGTPYRLGGTTRQGVDCSGFIGAIYKKVYHQQIQRTVAGIYQENCKHIRKSRTKQGDILFFNFKKRPRRQLSHAGIYLKRGYFVHASSSKGVIINHLSQDYYRKGWRKSGRINK